MKKERRNYYRILHVQPEAPSEIITASYRSLMTKLRHHPDLGGDHETAALINQAYAVLRDPEKRRAYDQALRKAGRVSARPGGVGRGASVPQSRESAICAYCSAALPSVIAADTRCVQCDSPLAPVRAPADAARELLGRRSGRRVDRSDPATIHVGLEKPPADARLKDLSPTGLGLFTPVPVQVGATVRIVTPTADMVARVVGARTRGQLHLVNARLLTAWSARRREVIV